MSICLVVYPNIHKVIKSNSHSSFSLTNEEIAGGYLDCRHLSDNHEPSKEQSTKEEALTYIVHSPLSFHCTLSLMASTVGQNSNMRIKFTSVKALAESPDLTSIPPSYTFTTNRDDETVAADPGDDDPIPAIDYSLLVHGTPDQRLRTIHDMGKACEKWGLFMLVNHSVSKSLVEKMVDEVFAFFNLREEEKQEYAGNKDVMEPIRYGTSFNVAMDKVLFWRDFLKIVVHPEFHSPDKPLGFRFLLILLHFFMCL